jgi:hypothetical protein
VGWDWGSHHTKPDSREFIQESRLRQMILVDQTAFIPMGLSIISYVPNPTHFRKKKTKYVILCLSFWGRTNRFFPLLPPTPESLSSPTRMRAHEATSDVLWWHDVLTCSVGSISLLLALMDSHSAFTRYHKTRLLYLHCVYTFWRVWSSAMIVLCLFTWWPW